MTNSPEKQGFASVAQWIEQRSSETKPAVQQIDRKTRKGLVFQVFFYAPALFRKRQKAIKAGLLGVSDTRFSAASSTLSQSESHPGAQNWDLAAGTVESGEVGPILLVRQPSDIAKPSGGNRAQLCLLRFTMPADGAHVRRRRLKSIR
jgi:hypothetical protein